jgi:hypothetical protein
MTKSEKLGRRARILLAAIWFIGIAANWTKGPAAIGNAVGMLMAFSLAYVVVCFFILRSMRRAEASGTTQVANGAGIGMVGRLGQVAWWAGAVLGATLLIFGLAFALFTNGVDRVGLTATCWLAAVIWTTPAWALSFVLAGSFWRPPSATAE